MKKISNTQPLFSKDFTEVLEKIKHGEIPSGRPYKGEYYHRAENYTGGTACDYMEGECGYYLGGVDLSVQQALAIVKVFKNNKVIRKLRIYLTELSKEAVSTLISDLSDNYTLTDFRIIYLNCNLSPDEYVNISHVISKKLNQESVVAHLEKKANALSERNEKVQKDIFLAAQKGNFVEFNKLFNLSFDLSHITWMGDKLLHAAVEGGEKNIIKALLESDYIEKLLIQENSDHLLPVELAGMKNSEIVVLLHEKLKEKYQTIISANVNKAIEIEQHELSSTKKDEKSSKHYKIPQVIKIWQRAYELGERAIAYNAKLLRIKITDLINNFSRIQKELREKNIKHILLIPEEEQLIDIHAFAIAELIRSNYLISVHTKNEKETNISSVGFAMLNEASTTPSLLHFDLGKSQMHESDVLSHFNPILVSHIGGGKHITEHTSDNLENFKQFLSQNTTVRSIQSYLFVDNSYLSTKKSYFNIYAKIDLKFFTAYSEFIRKTKAVPLASEFLLQQRIDNNNSPLIDMGFFISKGKNKGKLFLEIFSSRSKKKEKYSATLVKAVMSKISGEDLVRKLRKILNKFSNITIQGNIGETRIDISLDETDILPVLRTLKNSGAYIYLSKELIQLINKISCTSEELILINTFFTNKDIATKEITVYETKKRLEYSLFHYACIRGELEWVKLVATKTPDLNQLTGDQESALDLALSFQAENFPLIKWLLQQNINLHKNPDTDLEQLKKVADVELAIFMYERDKNFEYAVDNINYLITLMTEFKFFSAENDLLRRFFRLALFYRYTEKFHSSNKSAQQVDLSDFFIYIDNFSKETIFPRLVFPHLLSIALGVRLSEKINSLSNHVKNYDTDKFKHHEPIDTIINTIVIDGYYIYSKTLSYLTTSSYDFKKIEDPDIHIVINSYFKIFVAHLDNQITNLSPINQQIFFYCLKIIELNEPNLKNILKNPQKEITEILLKCLILQLLKSEFTVVLKLFLNDLNLSLTEKLNNENFIKLMSKLKINTLLFNLNKLAKKDNFFEFFELLKSLSFINDQFIFQLIDKLNEFLKDVLLNWKMALPSPMKQSNLDEKNIENKLETNETKKITTVHFIKPKKNTNLAFPIAQLKILLETTENLSLEKILTDATNNHNDTAPNTWTDWLLLKTFDWVTDKYDLNDYKSIRSAITAENFKKLLTTAYPRTRFFSTLITSFLRKENFSIDKALGNLNIKPQLEELQKYLHQFTDKNEKLNVDLLVIDILKNEKFITDLSKKIQHANNISNQSYLEGLFGLLAKLGIPGVDQEFTDHLLDIFLKIHNWFTHYEQKNEIDSLNKLAMHSLSANLDQTKHWLISILVQLPKLQRLINIFIDPLIKPWEILSIPAVRKIFKTINAQSSSSKLDLGKIINDHLLQKEMLWLFDKTPLGNYLKNHFDKLEFSGKETVSDLIIFANFSNLLIKNHSFRHCKFKNANFSKSKLNQCDFSGALFIDTLEIKETKMDIETAEKFIEALAISIQAPYSCKIDGKIILQSGPKQLVIPKFLKNFFDWDNQHVDVSFSSLPIFNQEVKSIINQELTETNQARSINDQDLQRAEQEYGGLLSGVLERLNMGSWSASARQALTSMWAWTTSSQEKATEPEITKDDEETYAKEQQTFNKKLKELSNLTADLEKQLANLNQKTEANADLHESIITKIIANQENISSLQEVVKELDDYWRAKQAIKSEQQELLTADLAVSTFYQTFRSRLSGLFLALFLIQNSEGLIDGDRKIFKLTRTVNSMASALEIAENSTGFLAKVMDIDPDSIAKAWEFLAKCGGEIANVVTKASSCLSKASSCLPVASLAIEGVHKLCSIGINFYEKGKVNQSKQAFVNLTPKSLEKMADAVARRVTKSSIQPLRLLEKSGSIEHAKNAALRVLTLLLNGNLSIFPAQFDLPSRSLMALRIFSVEARQQKFLWLVPIGDKNLANIKNIKLTSTTLLLHPGVYYLDLNIEPQYYGNENNAVPGKRSTNVKLLGFIEITQAEYQEVLREHVSAIAPDGSDFEIKQDAAFSISTASAPNLTEPADDDSKKEETNKSFADSQDEVDNLRDAYNNLVITAKNIKTMSLHRLGNDAQLFQAFKNLPLIEKRDSQSTNYQPRYFKKATDPKSPLREQSSEDNSNSKGPTSKK